MELQILDTEPKIAELIGDENLITSTQDALDMMGNADYTGARSIIVYKHQVDPEFFNLSSGLAGEILQKFSNYQMKLAIVGDFDHVESNALRAFIIESNRGNRVFFQPTREKAIEKLTK